MASSGLLVLFSLLSLTTLAVTSGRSFDASRLSSQLVTPICVSPQSHAVNANGMFAIDLYKKIVASSSDQNMIFSPFSVSTALAMTYGGANGVTKSQMASALRFYSIPWYCNVHAGFKSLMTLIQNGNSLNTANRVYIDTSFNLKVNFL